MKKVIYIVFAVVIILAIALILIYLSRSIVITQKITALRPLDKSELKNFLDKPELRPKMNPWRSNINFSGENIGDLYRSIHYYDKAHLVRDCAQDANEALARINQYLNEITNGTFSNSKIVEDTGTYFAIEYQVRDKLLKLYLINCKYLKFTPQTLAYNDKPTKIANIPHRTTQTEATGYIAFLQQLRDAGGTVIAQQIKQDKAIIKADILRMITSGGDWGLCDSYNSSVDHYEINVETGDIIYWQENGTSITGDCHPNPLE
jgi:hypothetical protein